jgi:preprotein translocase subunit SecE
VLEIRSWVSLLAIVKFGTEVNMAKFNPVQYLREVKREASKVTWPTRRETVTTTVMVFIMATIMSIFFLLVDQTLAFGIKAILGLGE